MGTETDKNKFKELRKRAQAFLTPRAEAIALSPEEINTLVHELDTYQIELELQNEDLRQAQQELVESRDRYNDLYDFAPVGYLTVSNKGLILEANLTATEMLGVERRLLGKQPFSGYILPADQEIYYHYHNTLLEKKEPQTCELRMQRKDDSFFYAYLKSSMIESVDGDSGQFRTAIIDISQRKQDELLLLESESRFRLLLDKLPNIAVQGYSADGTIHYWNQANEKIYGYTEKEAVGRDLVELIVPPEMQDFVRETMAKIARTGEVPPAEELRLLRKDGALVDVFFSHGVVQSPGHEPMLFCFDVDITERKKAEEKLKQSEERYHTLADYTYDWEFWIGPDGSFLYVSPSCERITGYRPDEFYKNPGLFEEIIHPDDQSSHVEHRCEITDSDKVHHLDFRIISRNGDIKWIGHNCQAVYDKAGNVLGRRASNRDITLLKKAEADLLRIKERYRTIVMDQYDLVCRFDPKGRLTFVNDAYCEYFSVKYTEILGTNFIPNIYKKDLPLVINQFKFLSPQHPKETIEHRVVLPDGKIRWQQWTGRAFFNEKNEIIEYQAVGRDITGLKETEAALRDAGAELEQRVKERTVELGKTHEQLLHAAKLAAIGSLSASIAHEFNNPLQGVMTILKGIQQHVPLGKGNEKLVGLALKECNRMKNLIASLQDFNRPSSGKSAPVDIHANIDSLLLLGKKDFKKRGITVEKDYADTMPHIMAVADQLKQVFLNLINNASYACEGGGTITIKTEKTGENVIIHIQDTGTGIKPENIEHIFEPFFTTKPELKGTGLGLSVSYGIIKKHGGEINVKSKPGKGTTFSVILPVKEANNE